MTSAVRSVKVAPSLLSADFARLGDEVSEVVAGGADLLHLDVMDGHFVPNITFGPPLVASVRRSTEALLDCHLMVERPSHFVEAFCEAGADWVSVHVEAPDDLDRALGLVRDRGRSPGVVLKPATPVERAFPWLDRVDFVLIMSVEPGFGGQAFMPAVLGKVRRLRAEGWEGPIAIDGGIGTATAPLALEAGVDVLVAGSAIFGRGDRAVAIRELRGPGA